MDLRLQIRLFYALFLSLLSAVTLRRCPSLACIDLVLEIGGINYKKVQVCNTNKIQYFTQIQMQLFLIQSRFYNSYLLIRNGLAVPDDRGKKIKL